MKIDDDDFYGKVEHDFYWYGFFTASLFFCLIVFIAWVLK